MTMSNPATLPSFYPGYKTAVFTKANVTAGGVTAWTTANSGLTLFTSVPTPCGWVRRRCFAPQFRCLRT